MKAVVYDRYGPPEVLRIEDVPRPALQPGEVLVRVHAAAVTRADVATREANRRSGPFVSAISRLVSGVRRPRQPVLGSEFAGSVEEAGSAVGQLKPGDRVFGSTGFRFGAYAALLAIRESGRIATMPAGMSFIDAASVCDGGLNALWALRQAEIQPGQEVLVYGASGAIGTAGVQLARHLGASVTAVCGAKNLELVRSLGAALAIDYQTEDFTRNGRRYDVIFDAVGKHSFTRSRGSLKPAGSYLATDGLGNLVRAVWGRRFGSQKVRFAIPPRYTKEDVHFLRGLIEAGEYRAVVDRTYPMEEVVEASRYVETEQKTGNVILLIED
jgi:NADPH:quinone reductase-like Zn-dependent oxidoreductase